MAKKFIDTNIFLRYLTRDDPAKYVADIYINLNYARYDDRYALKPLSMRWDYFAACYTAECRM